MTTRFEPASSADWKRIKTSSGIANAVESSAEQAMGHARSISPVVSGEYRDSFRVEELVERDRAIARLVNDADHAAAVEWGQQRHVLGRTADWIERGL